ncbi:glycerol-3-phosphate dehydrogenase/oxidase [Methylocaldum sp.]|uniref:glycerol-3-phosphate dehydrogenase/oxidase n=1 Tax=Methylocaldum sp. TaxID=1969727 RepID=UPI002D7161D3|nr:glycerol-3-phosphate dehydrogenase/oxidase [Methylocaldum sp.]HYE35222.1 glycerol-3-phosphate dehydrogenase/oxidase [Methylocaldum sp.]
MQRRFSDLKHKTFDLLVVGGGIYGAWTAYDAALRGFSTTLIDKGDWAGATSSASTKLIHGGLRYLAQGRFGLVRKSLVERQRLMRLCPHRVEALRFGIPVYRGDRLTSWRLRLGLRVYDLLGNIIGSEGRHERLGAEAFARRFPWVRATDLDSGWTYGDAQTDDARFVLELVDGSLAAGAVAVNYCEAIAYEERHGRAMGVIAKDRVTGEQTPVRARCIVNATGAWVKDMPGSSSKACRLCKGVHLILPRLPGKDALLFVSETDGRVVFFVPWYGFTLLGTTDTDYVGNPADVVVEQEDIDYLLRAANHVLGSVQWCEDDILGGFAGLRVLKGGDESAPSALSREWMLEELNNGVLISVGGKFTSARQGAAAIVDRVCRKLGTRRSCMTGDLAFPWAPGQDYSGWLQDKMALGRCLGLVEEEVRWLSFRHGKRIDEIFSLIERDGALRARTLPDLPFVAADLFHCARGEMIVHLDDLLRRRLPLLLLHRFSLDEMEAIAADIAPILGWDKARQRLEIGRCLADYPKFRKLA